MKGGTSIIGQGIYFLPQDFHQISPACGSKTYQMYGETLDFQCQHQ